MAYQLKTFADLIAAIREELHIQSSDTTSINRIKRDINITYSEVVAEKRWWWLQGHTNVVVTAYITSGTANVTSGSATVVLSEAPSASQTGRRFSVDAFTETYIVESHTAGSSTLKLTSPFTGSNNSTSGYKLWSEHYPLPTDCKETIEVYHDFHRIPLEGVGLQEMRRLSSLSPKAEGKPQFYHTGELVDPQQTSSISSLPALSTRSSAGVVKTLVFASSVPDTVEAGMRVRISASGHQSYNGEFTISSVSNATVTYIGHEEYTEAATADTTLTFSAIDSVSDYDRYRQLYVYPALSNVRVTLHVDYLREASPLEDDSDEPLLPVEDRTTLMYGALHRAWSRMRNPEEAQRNGMLYREKLAKMAGKLQDNFDKPKLVPSRNYLNHKRSAPRSRSQNNSPITFGAGLSGSVITGTANTVAVYNSQGDLDSLDAVSTTELGYLDGVSSNIQDQIDAISELADGKILVGDSNGDASQVTPTGDVTISNTGVTAIAAGVIVDADINSAAAIDRTKLAAGTAYRLVANDSNGDMSENAALTANEIVSADSNGQLASTGVSTTELTYLDDTVPLATATLTDNTASPTEVASWAVASYTTLFLAYSIKRDTAYESGIITLVSDGSSASIAQGAAAALNSNGVTLSTDVSGGNLRLLYVTTSTGTDATFKYKAQRWLA